MPLLRWISALPRRFCRALRPHRTSQPSAKSPQAPFPSGCEILSPCGGSPTKLQPIFTTESVFLSQRFSRGHARATLRLCAFCLNGLVNWLTEPRWSTTRVWTCPKCQTMISRPFSTTK